MRISQMTDAASLTGTEIMEVSRLSAAITITDTTISAQASDQSYNDSGSGFVTAGFAAGDCVNVTGFTGDTANNIYAAVITALTAAKMTIGGTDGAVIVDDSAGESVTITKWEARRTLAGYRSIPQNSQSGNYTTVAADAGKHLIHPSGAGAGDTFTIASNASVPYEVGTAITFINGDSNSLSIAITSDTLTLANTTTTGTRTLAQNGVATAVKISSTAWIISGTGLT